jgi:hypothetical protein
MSAFAFNVCKKCSYDFNFFFVKNRNVLIALSTISKFAAPFSPLFNTGYGSGFSESGSGSSISSESGYGSGSNTNPDPIRIQGFDDQN